MSEQELRDLVSQELSVAFRGRWTYTALAVAATLAGLALLVGGFALVSSAGADRTGMRWVITDLGAGIAVDINERGQVVGSSTTASGREHAFLWQNGTMRDLGTLGGAYTTGSRAVDINERGQIVGSSVSATISYGQLGAGVHAFLWQNGRMRDLGTLARNPPTSTAVAINDRGEIIGNSPATGDWGPFLWRNGKMINLGTLPGGSHSESVAINNRGLVIGDSVPRGPRGMSHAFVWQNGTMTDLGTLGGFVSVPNAINEHGQIVGGSNTASGKGRAVLWMLKRGA